MYKIKTPNGETFLTEKVTYVRQHSSGVYLITDQNRAEGINYHGENYRYDEGTQVHEVDSGDVYRDMEEINNITFVALAETKVLDDDTAARHATIFPVWEVGVTYKVGQMRIDPLNGRLYRLNEGHEHTSVEGWNPSQTPAMWTLVDVTHAGTMGDPIIAGRGMEYTEGLYYLDEEDGNLYLCTRGATLHYMPHELIGQYFEAA